MSILYENILGRLGARFHLNFLPKEKCVRFSPLGRFYDSEYKLSLGVRVGGHTRILPFSDTYESFECIEQELSATSVTFLARDTFLGLRMKTKITAPFYPEDEVLSGSPLFFMDVEIENTGKTEGEGDYIFSTDGDILKGEVFLQVENDGSSKPFTLLNGFGFPVECKIKEKIAKEKWLNKTRGKNFSSQIYKGKVGFSVIENNAVVCDNTISIPFKVKKQQRNQFTIIIAAYTDMNVLNIEDDLYRFKYTQWFKSLHDAIEYGHMNHNHILEKSGLFDTIIEESSINKSMKNLISSSLQSYLSNTWLTINSHNQDWFSVWEGNCAYHSTIDVEYNIAPLYLMLWPSLLEKTIDEWCNYEKPGAVMSHDCGKFLVIKGMEYSHDMEIEENTNLILLVHALYKYTGDKKLVYKHYDRIKRLMQYIYESDTTGNGFPNTGTANTIDDAGPAVQYSKEQTYLGIRALACYTVFTEFAAILKDESWIEKCHEMINKINKTLDEKAWTQNHYAVCIDKNANGIKHAWTGENMTGKIKGWDAYSIYAPNGLLYPLMTGIDISINSEKVKKHIIETTKSSMTHYGCKHSDVDDTGLLWISQNLWKDCIAAYLGIDMVDLCDKYWDYEMYVNSQGDGGCFVDTYPRPHLNYYPRGITSIALIYAIAGVKIDVPNKVLKLNPVRVPCKIPLLNFADWENNKVPWVIFSLNQGNIEYTLTYKECLKGYRLYVFDKQVI